MVEAGVPCEVLWPQERKAGHRKALDGSGSHDWSQFLHWLCYNTRSPKPPLSPAEQSTHVWAPSTRQVGQDTCGPGVGEQPGHGVRQTRQHTVRSLTMRQGLMTRGREDPHRLVSESSQPGGSKVPERRLVGPESGKTQRPPGVPPAAFSGTNVGTRGSGHSIGQAGPRVRSPGSRQRQKARQRGSCSECLFPPLQAGAPLPGGVICMPGEGGLFCVCLTERFWPSPSKCEENGCVPAFPILFVLPVKA